MGVSFKVSGSFAKTNKFLARLSSGDMFSSLNAYGQRGVDALSSATPKDTGETASSWRYKITKNKGMARIEWYNTYEVNGNVIAILLQYGHGTGTGGYVEGRDYINPAIRPIFDQIADDVWKKVIL